MRSMVWLAVLATTALAAPENEKTSGVIGSDELSTGGQKSGSGKTGPRPSSKFTIPDGSGRTLKRTGRLEDLVDMSKVEDDEPAEDPTVVATPSVATPSSLHVKDIVSSLETRPKAAEPKTTAKDSVGPKDDPKVTTMNGLKPTVKSESVEERSESKPTAKSGPKTTPKSESESSGATTKPPRALVDELLKHNKKALLLRTRSGEGIDALEDAETKIREYVKKCKTLVASATPSKSLQILLTGAMDLLVSFEKRHEKLYMGLAEIHSGSFDISKRITQIVSKKVSSPRILQVEINNAAKVLSRFDRRLYGSLKGAKEYSRIMVARAKAVTDKIRRACKVTRHYLSVVPRNGSQIPTPKGVSTSMATSSPKYVSTSMATSSPKETSMEVSTIKEGSGPKETWSGPQEGDMPEAGSNSPRDQLIALQKQLKQKTLDATRETILRKRLMASMKTIVEKAQRTAARSGKPLGQVEALYKELSESVKKDYSKLTQVYRSSNTIVLEIGDHNGLDGDEAILETKVQEAKKLLEKNTKALDELYNGYNTLVKSSEKIKGLIGE